MAPTAGPLLLLATYILGGLTFIPLVLVVLFLFSWVALPRRHVTRNAFAEDATAVLLVEGEDEVDRTSLKDSSDDADVAAGYFAVCREYVPGGVNGKPPERRTPAGETIAAESPSVYQSIYRSMFDRKTQVTSLEGGKAVKRARNVFYVVLRHGHLMLFDSSEQLEVRHVISLALYRISIRGEDECVPDGELWIKRNAIQLTRLNVQPEEFSHIAPFFFFSDNCSEKEDFYHALLVSQRKLAKTGGIPIPKELKFDTEHMIKLIRQLHVSEENIQTRWLNALVGRLFLALYKTAKVEDMVKEKIKKKILRVNKPTFITSLNLQDVSLGDGAPGFVNLRLREMTVDGSLTLEADVKYSGSFSAVVAAVARIDLGQRFKAREVDLVLAGVLKKLDGHLLILIKPPPSNRIWISFESMPKIQMTLEPIVSSRQITYGIILRAIESRIREVIGETLVIPNWDDIPFTHTEGEFVRGGIWESDKAKENTAAAFVPTHASDNDERNVYSTIDPSPGSSIQDLPLNFGDEAEKSEDIIQETPQSSSPPKIPSFGMRSNSFSGQSQPSPAVVTRIPVTTGSLRKRKPVGQRDAKNAMKSISSLSSDSNSVSLTAAKKVTIQGDTALLDAEHCESPVSDFADSSGRHFETLRSTDNGGHEDRSLKQRLEAKLANDRKMTINQSLNSATAAAKRWGLGVIQRQAANAGHDGKPMIQEPMGRGKPLPPPGQPLPGPTPSRTWATAALSLRRNTPPIPHSRAVSLDTSIASSPSNNDRAGAPSPPLPERVPPSLNEIHRRSVSMAAESVDTNTSDNQ